MQLIYIMDPMCSWCWAFSPALKSIQNVRPELPITYVMGGLAPDSDEPMPEEQKHYIASIWQQIAERTQTTFNFDFWTQCIPRRSTWRACRAVISAEQLQPGISGDMIQGIQEAYYLHAKNPSDRETLIAIAANLELDANAFASRLDSDATQKELLQQMQLGQQLGAQGFPALRLVHQEKVYRVSDGYTDAETLNARLGDLIKQLSNT